MPTDQNEQPSAVKLTPVIQQSQKIQAVKVTTLTILIVILTAAVSGGSVYLWKNREIQSLQDKLDEQPEVAAYNPSGYYPSDSKQYTETVSVIKKSFDPPYEVSWKENNRALISLTGLSLGDIKIEKVSSLRNPEGGKPFAIGAKVHVAIVKFKISSVGMTYIEECLNFSLRKVNTEGDFDSPISSPIMFVWSAGHQVCFPDRNATYDDQEMIFPVSQSDNSITLASTSKNRVSFTISFEDKNNIRVVDKHFPLE